MTPAIAPGTPPPRCGWGPVDWARVDGLNEEMIMSVNLYLRKSTWSLPALRKVSTASLRCAPVARYLNRSGEDLSILTTKLKSCAETFPVPPPPPNAPGSVAPQLNESTSISSLAFESRLSRLMPSVFAEDLYGIP